MIYMIFMLYIVLHNILLKELNDLSVYQSNIFIQIVYLKNIICLICLI